MNIRVLAIDDEPLALQQLAAYIRKISFLELRGQCSSAHEAFDIMEREVIDAIFCDINMPDLNGMDFVKQLAVPPLVVFTTAYADYAIEGYRVNAVDYLLKPFGLQDFQRAALKVRERVQQSQPQPAGRGTDGPAAEEAGSSPDSFFVKTDYRVMKLAVSDIRYIEGMSEYLKIHLKSQPKPVVTLLSMKKMEEYLPSYFMRIHRSYIINLKMIQEVNKNRVIMDADTYLPIGDNYKDVFNEYLNTKFLGK